MNKLHKCPNAWALCVPLSENVLRAITPPASIWLNFWAVAPAASQDGSPFVNLLDHNPESDSQFHSLRKFFVSNGDRPICFDPSHKVIKCIILSQEIRVTKTRVLYTSTVSSSPYRKQNYMERKVIIRKKVHPSNESKANGIRS